jgi:hypothetical protein
MEIIKFKDFNKSEEMANTFLSLIGLTNESNKNNIDKILKKLSKDLNFNIGLVLTFGTGINALYPIVDKLLKSEINDMVTIDTVVLLTITALSITYLDVKNRKGGNKNFSRKEAQSMLEELKMRGIGNGLVKKFVNIFKSIGEFAKELFKSTKYTINNIIDMFAYTSILIPFMNTINAFIGKYNMTVDNIISNLKITSIGIGTILVKHGVNWLVDKLASKFEIDINIENDDLNIEDTIDKEWNLKSKSDLINDNFN